MMEDKKSINNLYEEINDKTSCSEFLRLVSLAIPFKGVGFVELPEILPAKINSKYVFSNGKQVEDFQIFLGDTVRRELKNKLLTPDNFLVNCENLDNQEVISKLGIKVISRVPIFLDCNTIIGIIYFAHDKDILSDKIELFNHLSTIGTTYSRLFFREFGCDLPGGHAEVNLLKKMVDSNHDLISSVIHDLANPLTVIYFEAQKAMMNREKDISKSLTNIEVSIDQIYKIIDSTKKFFSKNKEKEDLESIKVGDVIDFISKEYGAQFKEKNLSFKSDGIDIEFIAYKDTFFNTVVGSLISNSIRYSEENSTIKIFGRETDGKSEIVIEDEAGGLPSDVLKNLRSNFKSSPSPSTSGDIGSGMGLVLAKSYLQIMNGSFHVECLGKGCRIILKMSK